MSERLTDKRLAELDNVANLRLSDEQIAEGYRLDGHMALMVRDSAAKEHFATLTGELREARARCAAMEKVVQAAREWRAVYDKPRDAMNWDAENAWTRVELGKAVDELLALTATPKEP